jgi:hypothetical protein
MQKSKCKMQTLQTRAAADHSDSAKVSAFAFCILHFAFMRGDVHRLTVTFIEFPALGLAHHRIKGRAFGLAARAAPAKS